MREEKIIIPIPICMRKKLTKIEIPTITKTTLIIEFYLFNIKATCFDMLRKRMEDLGYKLSTIDSQYDKVILQFISKEVEQ